MIKSTYAKRLILGRDWGMLHRFWLQFGLFGVAVSAAVAQEQAAAPPGMPWWGNSVGGWMTSGAALCGGIALVVKAFKSTRGPVVRKLDAKEIAAALKVYIDEANEDLKESLAVFRAEDEKKLAAAREEVKADLAQVRAEDQAKIKELADRVEELSLAMKEHVEWELHKYDELKEPLEAIAKKG